MDDFAVQLAREARRLGLTAGEVQDAEVLLAFAELVLTELAARGLVPDAAPQLGCWARPRLTEN